MKPWVCTSVAEWHCLLYSLLLPLMGIVLQVIVSRGKNDEREREREEKPHVAIVFQVQYLY